LKLINLTPEQERRSDLKYVYELPQSIDDLKKLFKKLDEEQILIVIQRIRDYYNPKANTAFE
jgi:hypothetical protein